MLEVAKRLETREEIAFLIIGSGAQEELVKQCKLSNVTYLERIPHDQIMHAIAACQLGLSFRIDGKISQDAFPVKVYEYIGIGVPILVTPVSEASAFVKDKQIGLEFTNSEVDEICEAILRFANDKSYYTEFTNRVSTLNSNFDRSVLCQEFLNIFDKELPH